MVSPVDVLCLVMFVGLMALEGRRGIIPALVDFLCILLGLIGIRLAYMPFSEQVGPPSFAYLLLAIVVLVLTAGIAVFMSVRLKVNVTATEAAVGAFLGLCTAAVISYGFFEYLAIRYGAHAPIITDSVLSWQLYEFRGYQAFVDFMRTLMGRS
ncbi:MAG: hypothetical protein U9R79_19540 [Armatimonadota bacterium]|nr:hypothetical protein [Armatimonadota bacterium]